jgi:NADH-quinone oxidoreductase subunit M
VPTISGLTPTSSTAWWVFYLFIIHLALTFLFLTDNIIIFYIAFETTLLPFFLWIGEAAVRNRRWHAAFFLVFFTLIGSIGMLWSICVLYKLNSSFCISDYVHTYFRVRHGWYFKANPLWHLEYFHLTEIPDLKGYFKLRDLRVGAVGYPDRLAISAFFLFTFSFLIKFPVFPVASWLPEAHVEASTEASVLLAAVLLKVAPFGFYKIIIPSFTVWYIQYCSYLWIIGLSSAIVYVFSLLVQTDLKRAIAYTSIIHMSIMLCLLGSTNKTSLDSAFLMGALHSFCSAGLFCSIGYLYEKDKNKNLNYVSGLAETRPIFSALFMLFNLVNVGYPLIGSYISEILLFVVAEDSKNRFYTFVVVIVLYILTSAIFFMMSKLFYRSWSSLDVRKILDLTRDEYFSLGLLLGICTILGLFPSIYLVYIEDSIFNLLYIIKLAKPI